MPVQKDLSIWKGNSTPQVFRFKTRQLDGSLLPLDLTGSVLVFRAVWVDENGDPESLRLESPNQALSVTDPAGGELVLQLGVANTRLLPTGQKARYEIERRIAGEQRTLAYGTLKVSEWANDD
ncbi:MAG: hypothetical protein U1E62_21785 [Alsobacter sp.]